MGESLQPSSSSLTITATTTPSSTKNRQPNPQSISKISSNTNTKKTENTTRSIYGTNGLVIPESQVNQTTTSSSTRKQKLSKLEKLVGVRRPATLGTAPTTAKRKPELPKPPRKKIIISDSSSVSSSDTSSSDSSPSPKSLSLLSDNENEEIDDEEEVRPSSSTTTTTKKNAPVALLPAQLVKSTSEPILNNIDSKKKVESSAECEYL